MPTLDFWAHTDHAEALTPRHWGLIKDNVRQCNALSGDPTNPDLVTFLGFEWTQVGLTPATHWGHKNVIFRDTAEDEVPARPITSGAVATRAMRQDRSLFLRFLAPYADFDARRRVQDLDYKVEDLASKPFCPQGVDTRALPGDCIEEAPTPQVLFEKLGQWGFPSMVIPHGLSWGLYTPPGASLDKQLAGGQHDPERQQLLEVFSGHGNSEEYRDWRAVRYDAEGNAVCPEPSHGYRPCCHVAGEIIRARCDDLPAAECDQRVTEAEQHFLAAGTSGRQTVPGASMEDWGDCGQCADCYAPAFAYRPGGSAQYALAIGNFDEPKAPRHFQFGFLASSDNHSARPGTGYKEFARTSMTEARTANALGTKYATTHVPDGGRPDVGRLRSHGAPRIDPAAGVGHRTPVVLFCHGWVGGHACDRARSGLRLGGVGAARGLWDQWRSHLTLVRSPQCWRRGATDGVDRGLRRCAAVSGAGGRGPRAATRVSRA